MGKSVAGDDPYCVVTTGSINVDLDNYYVIPFCISLLDHQPSGTLSINDDDKLNLSIRTTCKTGRIYIVAMQYEVIRIHNNQIGSTHTG